MIIIGMKRKAIRRHAPGNTNDPAGAKSRVAMAPSPTISFVKALIMSFIFLIYIKIYLYKKAIGVIVLLFLADPIIVNLDVLNFIKCLFHLSKYFFLVLIQHLI